MTIPMMKELARPALQEFTRGAQNAKSCMPALAQRFALTTEDQEEMLPSGTRTRFFDRVDWACFHLLKAGFLRRIRRGVYEITDEGRAAIDTGPAVFDNAYFMSVPAYAAFKAGDATAASTSVRIAAAAPMAAAPTDEATPEERMRIAHRELSASLAEELLAAVLDLSPERFERLVVQLLIAMGYGKGDPAQGKAVGKSGDGGIDGVINEDALGLDAVYIQAKRYAPGNTVGRPDLQAFVGAMTGEGATKGVFFTTSAFTSGAKDYVRMVQQRIVLVDGDRLARLMIAHGVGVRPQMVYTVLGIDEAAFSDI